MFRKLLLLTLGFTIFSIKSEIIPGASYYITKSSHFDIWPITKVRFYSSNGNLLYKTWWEPVPLDIEKYLDPAALKPRPTNYEIKWSKIDSFSAWIYFFDKNGNNLGEYIYYKDEQVIFEENKKYPFHASHLEKLADFPLDLSIVNEQKKKEKGERFADEEIIAYFSKIDRIKTYSLKALNLVSGIVSPLAWMMIALERKEKMIPGMVALSVLGISCITDKLLKRMKLKEHFDTKTNIFFAGIGLGTGFWARGVAYAVSLLDSW